MKIYKDQTARDRARKAAVLLLGAFAYALLFALCSQIDQSGETALGTTIVRLVLAYPVALIVLWSFVRVNLPKRERTAPHKPFCTFGAFVLIFASFVPMFLIEYPGSFMYDTQRQAFQIATGDYDMFHPLAHTLLIRLCISLYGMLGSFEKCAAVYSVLSMLMMAGCFSLLCASISRSFGRTAARVSTAFFCLYPAHMAFASNCTKDGLFSAFFALFLALAVERIVRGGMARRHTALMVIAGAMACLFRNNMIYAMAVWAAVLLCIKGNMRRLGALALACCALGYGVNQGMGALLDAGGGNIVEMLSVPIQQLARARVLAPEAFDEDEAAAMDAVFKNSIYNLYEPTLADPVKNRLEESDVRANMGALADAYMSVGRKRPDIYLDAFLNLALPSLYPYGEYRVAQPYIEVGIQPGGVLTGPFGQAPLTQPGRFEAVREALKTLIYDTGADHVPLVRWLFNCGAIFWLLLALWLRMAYRGNLAAFGALLLAVLLWATFLLGPVMQGRYLYPFICALPLFACCACDHTRQKTKETL